MSETLESQKPKPETHKIMGGKVNVYRRGSPSRGSLCLECADVCSVHGPAPHLRGDGSKRSF
jgi:hypothetical protein